VLCSSGIHGPSLVGWCKIVVDGHRLVQARVMNVLAEGISDIWPDDTRPHVANISQHSAIELSPHLPDAVSEVRQAVAAGFDALVYPRRYTVKRGGHGGSFEGGPWWST